MLYSARTKMPALDYVSIVRSLFRDRLALSVGTIASATAAAIAGLNSHHSFHYVIAGLFVLLAAWRYFQATRFDRVRLEADDAEGAEHWEMQATVSGAMAAMLYGMWCFYALVFDKSAFSVLASMSVSIAAMVGIVARNFGLDRLVTIQLLLLGVPLCAGLALDGNIYHILLAALFAPMLMSYRALAGDIRNVLLSAVRDRSEVARLAEELDTAMSTMSHGLLMLDQSLRVIVANAQAQEMLFSEVDYLCIGKEFREVIERTKSSGMLSPLCGQRLATAVAIEGQSKIVLQLLDGRQCEVSINRSARQTVLVLEDITERVQSESRIKFMARFDPATNLPNRAYFSEQVAGRLRAMAHNNPDAEIAFLSLDVDDFKNINDTYGHPLGDRVLAHVARRLRQSLDSSVLVGRFGGDEFTAFFERDVTRERMDQVIASLLEVLGEPFTIDNTQMQICMSAGLVVARAASSQLEGLLKRADLALYRAKENGKGRVAVFSNDMLKAYEDKQVLKEALREAIDLGQLMLAFQPVVDLNSRKVVGCEALARWHHKELGVIPPDVFIPLAEEMGVVSEITDWVLHCATRECASWPDNIGVAVNISADDFKGRNVQEMVDSALQVSGLLPERLEIEVTETVLVEEMDIASRVLSEVAALGVGIALDDFGTGYSSLGYLHSLPFTKLKIDRTFTMDVTEDPRALRLMRNIAVLGRDLNMKITVEGVETEEQLETVAEIGLVSSIQGYLFGAPVPQSEIAQLIRTLSGKGAGGQDASAIGYRRQAGS